MQPVPRIFVSATSRDLRTARQLVAEGLRRLECLPIVQDDFPPDYKSVRDMLRTKIQTCNAVVHLAGFYYGAEPQPVLPGPDRRSFTQMEYEIAMELKLPTYVFLCGEHFPFDVHDPEPEEKRQLQLAHRQRLLQRDELFYEFASPEELANRTRELQLSVENLRKELVKERGRRRMAMVAAVAALLIAVVGGLYLSGRLKKEQAVNVEQSSQIAQLRAQLETPWMITAKVNAALEALPKDQNLKPDEAKKVAISMVSAELKKSPEDIQKAIEATTELSTKLLAAVRTEGGAGGAKTDANRALEAETLGKLAASHEAAGRYAEALRAYQDRLAVLDREKQPEDWMEARIAVAEMSEKLSKEADAEAGYREALEFGSKNPKLGLEHRLVNHAYSNLRGLFVYQQENFAAAEKLCGDALATRKAKLGGEHALTLRAMADLAHVYSAERKQEKAESLILDAYKTATRVLGKEDSATIEIISRAASIMRAGKDMKTAVDLQRRVVAYREKSAGKDSRTYHTSAVVLAGMLQRIEEFDEAQTLLDENLDFAQAENGPDHPDTLWARELLASQERKKGNLEKATKLYRAIIADRQRVQGPNAADTLDTKASLAVVLYSNDDKPGAAKVEREVLTGYESLLGPTHAQTISAAYQLMQTLWTIEDYAGAEQLARRVLAFREKNSTIKNDPEVAEICDALGSILDEGGKRDEALTFAKRAVAIAQAALPEDDEDRQKYEARFEKMQQPESAKPKPKPRTATAASSTPSLSDFAAFRKQTNEKLESEKWEEVKVDLPGAKAGRKLYVVGWIDGDNQLRKVMRVDEADDKNGTWTFYYWNKGSLASVVRVREGSGVPIKDVATATDTYNFVDDQMVSWRRTQDDNEKVEDSKDPDFAERGEKVLAEAGATAKPLQAKLSQ